MRSSKDNSHREGRRQKRGQESEELAARFFREQGFEILERNWRAGHKELDLIARQDNLIVFVEVKSSRTKKFGHPVEWISRRKIRNLTEAAQQYLVAKGIENTDLRFDVVTFSDGQLEHFPDAFPAA